MRERFEGDIRAILDYLSEVTYEAAAAGVKEKFGLDDVEVQKDMKLYW